MGAPVVSYCRIDDRPIRTHEPIAEPDALIVQDATLVHQVDLFGGLADDGLRAGQHVEELRGARPRPTSRPRFRPDRLLTCPATALALEHLGRPLPNAALLGGFAALTGRVSLDALEQAIGERFAGAGRRGQRGGGPGGLRLRRGRGADRTAREVAARAAAD